MIPTGPDSTKQVKNFVYSIHDQIGQGFSSQVYKGTNINNGQPVALKVIDLKSIKTEVEKMLLGNELKALRQLKHENIIETHDICQTNNNVYIVTEYCNQGDLTSQIKIKGKFTQQEALKYFRQIVNGLSLLAYQGILHRDIKTANILLKDGTAKIADFGFCDYVHDQKNKHLKYNVGSPLYMSPEAYRKSIYSYKSEIWAVGIILYEMLLGEQPFRGIDYDSLVKTIASGQIYKTISVNGFTKMLLSRMLSIDIQRRININQLIELLNQNNQVPRMISENIMPGNLTNQSLNLKNLSVAVPHLNPTSMMKKSIHIYNSANDNSSFGRQLSLTGLAPSSTTSYNSKPIMSLNTFASSLQRPPLSALSLDNNTTKNNQFEAFYSNNPTLEGKSTANGFEKKKTPVLPSYPEPLKRTFNSKVDLPRDRPFLISFESHLSTYSTTHPEFTSASEKLLTSKFLYRICKLLSEVQTMSNSRCKRLFLLALRHLELSLKYFELENFFYIAESSEQSSYKKILAKTKLYRNEYTDQYSEDEYFSYVVSESQNFNSEVTARYIQFWIRLALRDIGELVQTATGNLSNNFDSYEVQHLFACYMYALKYYEMLDVMRGRTVGEDPPSSLGLPNMLLESPNVSSDGFIVLCQSAKKLVK